MKLLARLIVAMLVIFVGYRLLMHASAIYSPFIIDDDIPSRSCAKPTSTVITLAAGQLPLLAEPATVLSRRELFAYPPEGQSPGIFLEKVTVAGCDFWFGHVPQSVHRAEVRRLGVMLRHVQEPVVLVSYLRHPAINLTTGVLARASGTRFASMAELVEHPRILGSQGVRVDHRDVLSYTGSIAITLPGA